MEKSKISVSTVQGNDVLGYDDLLEAFKVDPLLRPEQTEEEKNREVEVEFLCADKNYIRTVRTSFSDEDLEKFIVLEILFAINDVKMRHLQQDRDALLDALQAMRALAEE